MKVRFYILLLAATAMLALALFVARRDFHAQDAQNTKSGEKVFKRVLAEGLQVSRSGCYGIDFVKCGSCRLEKRKKGILTFGGLNVLVMENLSIVILPAADKRLDDGKEADVTPSGIAQRLGVTGEFLSMRGLPLKFSGLRISGLEVSRLVDADRTELVFTARKAEAVRGGLSLRDGTVKSSPERMESFDKAMLTRKDDTLRLSWSGGEMELM